MERKKEYFIVLIIVIIVFSIIIFNIQNKYFHSKTHLPPPSLDTIVVAFISDAKPALGKNDENLIEDFNQIKLQSPGNLKAIVAVGDNNPLNGKVSTNEAYNSSIVKNIPLFYVIGNHELLNINDLPFAENIFKNYSYSPNPGPDGSRNTTYSFDVGNMHIIILNEYWDGDYNGICDWYRPNNGLNRDDSCFKYTEEDGGFIPDKLFNWLENDLKNNIKKRNIVVGHEPLYPQRRHVGDALDENVSNRDKLEKLFISNGVVAFIGGHTHIAGIQKIDNIFHVDAGVFGDNKYDGDNFASIIFAYVDKNGNFDLEWRYENPTWINPGLKIFTES